jgi:hypothetical protein
VDDLLGALDAELGENAIEVAPRVTAVTIKVTTAQLRPTRAIGRSYSGSACAQVRPITSQQRAHRVHGLHGALFVDGLDRHHRDVLVVG